MVGPSTSAHELMSRRSFNGDSKLPASEITYQYQSVQRHSVSSLTLLIVQRLALRHFGNGPLLYAEHFIVATYLMQNTIQMLPVGIRYKDLPEIITCHELDNLLHTRSSSLSKISSSNSNGTVAPVRFRKSNCASFKATR